MIIDYEPHPAQQAIHAALRPFLSSKIVMCITGRQFGKTEFAIQEINKRAIEIPNARIWYIAPTKQQAFGIAWRRLLQVLPKSEMKKSREDLHYVEMNNGSLIEFKGMQHEFFEWGATLHLAVFDEFPGIPYSAWVDTVRPMLLRHRGDALFIGTVPDPKETAIEMEFLDMFEKGLKKKEKDREGIVSFTYSTYENPHMPKEEIDKQVREIERKGRHRDAQRLYFGKYTREYGIIFPKFSWDAHTVEPRDIPRDWTRLMAVDPHSQKPVYGLWAAIDPRNHYWFYRERKFILPDGRSHTVQETASEILYIENQARERVRKRLIDPTFAREQQHIFGLSNVQQLFKDYGLHFESANRDFLTFFNQMTDRLVDQPEPSIHIFRTCPELIWQMENYAWDSWASRWARRDRGAKDKPKKKDDDFIDCSKYILNTDLRYIDPVYIENFKHKILDRWEKGQFL